MSLFEMLLELKHDGGGNDNWSYKDNAVPVDDPTVSRSTERKMYQRSTDLFTTSSPRRFPTLPLTTKGSWLPCYRPMPVAYHCPKECSIIHSVIAII